jgi:2-methylcitrate dehydratase PrpD
METAAQALAKFALDLHFEDIPREVLDRAKACILDTIAVTAYGADLSSGRILVDYVKKNSPPGKAAVWGTDLQLQPAFAAFANGALAHGCEYDCTYYPTVNAHSGASLLSPGLALAQTRGLSGKELLTAFVAGSEVMHRVGHAGNKSIEKRGFHAPGFTGVFGGIVAAGKLMGLDVDRLTNALGIGGSLGSGSLECAVSGGGMVKHMHIGRAAESAVVAVSLAENGFTGPASVFEGKYGMLNALAQDPRPERLTADLGTAWRTLMINHKSYPLHTLAQTPIAAVSELRVEHKLSGPDVASILVEGNPRIKHHHDIPEPKDVMMAQYSTAFSIALSFFREIRNPGSYSPDAVNDPAIRALCRKVRLEILNDPPDENACRVTIAMRDGRSFSREITYAPGMPQRPFTRDELRGKYDALMKAAMPRQAEKIFLLFESLEDVADLGAV